MSGKHSALLEVILPIKDVEQILIYTQTKHRALHGERVKGNGKESYHSNEGVSKGLEKVS